MEKALGLDVAGIRYLHLKGLGDPKPGRVAAREGRFSDFRRIFAALSFAKPGEHASSYLAPSLAKDASLLESAGNAACSSR